MELTAWDLVELDPILEFTKNSQDHQSTFIYYKDVQGHLYEMTYANEQKTWMILIRMFEVSSKEQFVNLHLCYKFVLTDSKCAKVD